MKTRFRWAQPFPRTGCVLHAANEIAIGVGRIKDPFGHVQLEKKIWRCRPLEVLIIAPESDPIQECAWSGALSIE
jgi:hypothetical protein